MFLFQYLYCYFLKEKDEDISLFRLIQNLFFLLSASIYLYFCWLFFAGTKGHVNPLNLTVYDVIMVLLGVMLSFLLSRSEVFILKPKKDKQKSLIPILEVILWPGILWAIRLAILASF